MDLIEHIRAALELAEGYPHAQQRLQDALTFIQAADDRKAEEAAAAAPKE